MSHFWKEGSILWFFCQNRGEKNQFFASYSRKKSSILCVIFKKEVRFFESIFKKEVRFFESHCKKFHSMRHIVKKSSILWDTPKMRSIYLSHVEKILKRGSILRVKIEKTSSQIQRTKSLSHVHKKRFNSLSHIGKKGSILSSHIQKSGSILRVKLKRECSILWVFFSKMVQ